MLGDLPPPCRLTCPRLATGHLRSSAHRVPQPGIPPQSTWPRGHTCSQSLAKQPCFGSAGPAAQTPGTGWKRHQSGQLRATAARRALPRTAAGARRSPASPPIPLSTLSPCAHSSALLCLPFCFLPSSACSVAVAQLPRSQVPPAPLGWEQDGGAVCCELACLGA